MATKITKLERAERHLAVLLEDVVIDNVLFEVEQFMSANEKAVAAGGGVSNSDAIKHFEKIKVQLDKALKSLYVAEGLAEGLAANK